MKPDEACVTRCGRRTLGHAASLRRDLKYALRLAQIDTRIIRLSDLGVAERQLPRHDEKVPLRRQSGRLEEPMEVIGFNGSSRKNRNTATLLEKALEGAASHGAKTKLVHLYDLDFKGCRSCFGCRTGRAFLPPA